MPGADPLLGQTVGNYEVTQKLGEGGMGSVYLAEHPKIGKRVALKVLHAEFSNNQDVVTRFFNEARSVNDIQHPNIVDIIDYGIIPNGPRGDTLVYFIMEFLSGKTLTDALKAEAPFPPERAFAIALQVADALAASHRCGVVHRDLKPDNIMLSQRGRDPDFVKLLDFGIAKLTGDQPGSRKTRTGIVMGTPWYMSPEQCDGRGFIDHRTDIYALGVVLYEMVAGRMPFLGEGYGEVLVQHLTQAPPPPSTFRGMSPYVEAVILKALEKRPEQRYPTADEFMRALLDPVGYVEANGGLLGFAGATLATQGAMPPTTRLTPIPMTPLPGSLAPMRTPPPMAAPTAGAPTTLGGAAGMVPTAPTRSGPPVGLLIGGVVIAAAAAIAAVLIVRGGGDAPAKTTLAGVPPADAHPASAPDATPAGAMTPPPIIDAAPAASPPDAIPPVQMVQLKIETDPPGATVTFDGAERGETPLTFEVPREARKAQLTLELRGHGSVREEVDLRANFSTEIALKARGSSPTPPRPKPPKPKPPKPTGPDLMEPE
ncbi:MAG: protein kinase [Kofleriaceae bacterium]